MTKYKTGYKINMWTIWERGEMVLRVDIEKLILERANQGLTLDQLSKKSGVGRSTISRIERGEVKGRIDTIARIAKGLGKTAEDFIVKQGGHYDKNTAISR